MNEDVAAYMSVINIRDNGLDSDNAPYPRNRKRKWHSKVPTGCIKCKERRIKCSEERPGCRRCIKLGIPCPGYKTRIARIFEFQPRTSPQFESALEKARHDYFVDVGSRQLSTFQLNTSLFFTRLVPQLSHRHAAVRHALTALGAVQAPLQNMPLAQLQFGARPTTFSMGIWHMHRSMHIIGTADPATLPVEVSLACCMLFTALQFWLEKSALLRTHILAAYRILQEKLGPDISRWTQSQAVPKEFAAIYIPALNDLINHACTFSDNFPPATSGIPADYHLGFDPELVHPISGKEGAVDAMDRLLKCILRAGNEGQSSPTLEEKIIIALGSLKYKLLKLQHAGILCEEYDWTHLQLHLQVARVMFQGLGRNDEASFDSCAAEFVSIVAYCKRLVHLDVHDPPKATGNLRAHLGLLPPLLFVATRCRDSIIRREALKVLHEVGVSERGWTSCQAFALANFVVKEEETLNKVSHEGGMAAQIHRRIRLHDIEVSGASHTATISYDVFSPGTDGDNQSSSSPSATCDLGDVARHRSVIRYPSHPVVELDGGPYAIPGKALRASGYSGILLIRPPLPCHCGFEDQLEHLPAASKSPGAITQKASANNGTTDAHR